VTRAKKRKSAKAAGIGAVEVVVQQRPTKRRLRPVV
jgi:hypothetical protein